MLLEGELSFSLIVVGWKTWEGEASGVSSITLTCSGNGHGKIGCRLCWTYSALTFELIFLVYTSLWIWETFIYNSCQEETAKFPKQHKEIRIFACELIEFIICLTLVPLLRVTFANCVPCTFLAIFLKASPLIIWITNSWGTNFCDAFNPKI